jgi:hypothetical protein
MVWTSWLGAATAAGLTAYQAWTLWWEWQQRRQWSQRCLARIDSKSQSGQEGLLFNGEEWVPVLEAAERPQWIPLTIDLAHVFLPDSQCINWPFPSGVRYVGEHSVWAVRFHSDDPHVWVATLAELRSAPHRLYGRQWQNRSLGPCQILMLARHKTNLSASQWIRCRKESERNSVQWYHWSGDRFRDAWFGKTALHVVDPKVFSWEHWWNAPAWGSHEIFQAHEFPPLQDAAEPEIASVDFLIPPFADLGDANWEASDVRKLVVEVVPVRAFLAAVQNVDHKSLNILGKLQHEYSYRMTQLAWRQMAHFHGALRTQWSQAMYRHVASTIERVTMQYWRTFLLDWGTRIRAAEQKGIQVLDSIHQSILKRQCNLYEQGVTKTRRRKAFYP